jgi:dTDP-4-amino-4,6-dideoxygalactose transaminase
MTHYNPWPLGNLPEAWRRPEPEIIKSLGYLWEDPRDIIGIFEKKLAQYSGSKYAVLTDCCSNALYLALKYRNFKGKIDIPENTYLSIPMQILHAGCEVNFVPVKWQGLYKLDPVGIIDGAGRFRKNMYEGGDNLHLLSFQIKKRVPIGRGGAILTNSEHAYNWLKLASYDGRDLNLPYQDPSHIKAIGWHFYMTPEDAARGIIIMDQLSEDLEDITSWENYPNLKSYDYKFTNEN